MYYRRTEAEMTAYPFEYEFAKQEGVEFRWLSAPKRILGKRDGFKPSSLSACAWKLPMKPDVPAPWPFPGRSISPKRIR